MGKALDAEQFVAYAKRQIRTALDILDGHHADLPGVCACGRTRPCSVVATCHHTIAHYEAKLAVVGATQPLRIIERRSSVAPAPAHRLGTAWM
ncbi:hypothetical protein [Catellatospora methionotrophica]|uniref:hypothetical protein n=1 Tax=Catellatospora methionotrophica TaxID=121620 RepID=UPI0033C41C2A